MRINKYFIIATFLLGFCTPLFCQNLALLRQQAVEGDSSAMLKLVEVFEFGLETKQYPDSAAYWLSKAADKKHPEAQYLLGIRLVKKIYDAKIYAKGVNLLKSSAENGYTEALLKLTEIYLENGSDGGSGTVSASYYNPATAFKYAKKAAESGSGTGAYLVGDAYVKGKGVSKNYKESALWFEKGARLQNTPSQLNLGDLHLTGKITGKVELMSALAFYRMAWINNRSTPNEKALADIGMHEVDQRLKQTHNLMMQAGLLTPGGSFQYKLRE